MPRKYFPYEPVKQAERIDSGDATSKAKPRRLVRKSSGTASSGQR